MSLLAITTTESGGETPKPVGDGSANPIKVAMSIPTARRPSPRAPYSSMEARQIGLVLPTGGAGGTDRGGGGGIGIGIGTAVQPAQVVPGYNTRAATDTMLAAGQQSALADQLADLDMSAGSERPLDVIPVRPSSRLHTRLIGVAGTTPPPPAGSYPPGTTAVMPAGHGSPGTNPALHPRVYVSAPQFSGVIVAPLEDRRAANARGRSDVPQSPSGVKCGGAVIVTRDFNLRLRNGVVMVPRGTVVVDAGEIYLLEVQRAPIQPYDMRNMHREAAPWEDEGELESESEPQMTSEDSNG